MNTTRLLGIGAWTMAALLGVGCATTVETNGTTGGGGTTGTGQTGSVGGSVGTGPIGEGGGPSCPSGGGECCAPGQFECCFPCGTTTTGTGMGGAGGSIGSCGGFIGTTCAADEYCDYSDNTCGGGDEAGVCTKKPVGCDDLYWPVCGCDGQVHDNECDANQAGVDVADDGFCKPPPGTFSCGAHFCTLGKQYCQFTVSDVSTEPSDYACLALPASCDAVSCACLTNVPCGQQCKSTPDQGVEVECPGG